MEKERRIKTLAIVVLVIAVLGLTIAFAALSQTLTIIITCGTLNRMVTSAPASSSLTALLVCVRL